MQFGCFVSLEGIRKRSEGLVHISQVQTTLYRGSYMSAHVLLNLLNKLGKSDKMRGLTSILSLFSQRV